MTTPSTEDYMPKSVGRPPKRLDELMQRVSAAIDPDWREEIDGLAAARRCNRSEMLRRVIRAGLEVIRADPEKAGRSPSQQGATEGGH